MISSWRSRREAAHRHRHRERDELGVEVGRVDRPDAREDHRRDERELADGAAPQAEAEDRVRLPLVRCQRATHAVDGALESHRLAHRGAEEVGVAVTARGATGLAERDPVSRLVEATPTTELAPAVDLPRPLHQRPARRALVRVVRPTHEQVGQWQAP